MTVVLLLSSSISGIIAQLSVLRNALMRNEGSAVYVKSFEVENFCRLVTIWQDLEENFVARQLQ